MDSPWNLCDDLGPEKIIHLHNPQSGLKAILVVDNVACGPSIGGARLAPDVSLTECARLARAMTMKNAAAGLPHGGGKSVIWGDPMMPAQQKEHLMRAFARAIADVRDYIVGPDMGTDERCMAWAFDEIGRAVGLPAVLGGIPLDEIGATGFGLAVCAEAAQDYSGVSIDGARIAVQGFGAVGRHAARFLAERGARLVAACDSRATVQDPAGLDVEQLAAHKAAGGGFDSLDGANPLARDAIIDAECDVWIPAARPDVLTADNQSRLKARLVLCGANIPATSEAERALAARGVLVVPDFIANAGGVICAAVEYHGGTRESAFSAIEEKILANTQDVLSAASREGETPRDAAVRLAERRVRDAMALRRFQH